MAFVPFTLAALKSELLNDPSGLGYVALEGQNPPNDQAVADCLNFVRDGVTPCPANAVVGAAIVLPNPTVMSSQVLLVIADADITTGNPSIGLCAWFNALMTGLNVKIPLLQADLATENTVIKNLRKFVGGGATPSGTAITALKNGNYNRMVQLFGYNAPSASANLVGQARNS